jgi:hypothetical protein
MARRFHVTGSQVAAVDPITEIEERARAKYLRMRQLPGTNYVLTDAGLYPTRGSAGLRAASDKALAVELEASIGKPKT